MEQTDKFNEAVDLLISKGLSHGDAVDWVGWNGYEEAFEVFRGDEPRAIKQDGFIRGLAGVAKRQPTRPTTSTGKGR